MWVNSGCSLAAGMNYGSPLNQYVVLRPTVQLVLVFMSRVNPFLVIRAFFSKKKANGKFHWERKFPLTNFEQLYMNTGKYRKLLM